MREVTSSLKVEDETHQTNLPNETNSPAHQTEHSPVDSVLGLTMAAGTHVSINSHTCDDDVSHRQPVTFKWTLGGQEIFLLSDFSR